MNNQMKGKAEKQHRELQKNSTRANGKVLMSDKAAEQILKANIKASDLNTAEKTKCQKVCDGSTYQTENQAECLAHHTLPSNDTLHKKYGQSLSPQGEDGLSIYPVNHPARRQPQAWKQYQERLAQDQQSNHCCGLPPVLTEQPLSLGQRFFVYLRSLLSSKSK